MNTDDAFTDLRPPWAELRQNGRAGVLTGLAVLALALPPRRPEAPTPPRPLAAAQAHPAVSDRAARLRAADAALESLPASAQARQLARWVLESGDHGGRPFVILDKREAMLLVLQTDGRLAGATPVLLGAARGDDNVEDIGLRPMHAIRDHEKTTPAGRFQLRAGRNATGEDVLWVDYDAAVSIHRVREVEKRERRLQRLASPRPQDRRISYGCINVPPRFYEEVLLPVYGAGRPGGLAYVLPEQKSLRQVFRGDLPDTPA